MKSRYLLLSIILLSGCESLLPDNQVNIINPDAVVVHATRETEPVRSRDDAADDPAIWVNAQDVTGSLVLGTDKQWGLMVYDLQGSVVQALERGRLNNVDLRQGIILEGEALSLAVATNRTDNSLDVFTIDAMGEVTFVHAEPLTLSEPYGVCMYLDTSGLAHAFVNSTDGEYQQWLLNPDGMLGPELAGSYRLDSQPEGCAADDSTGTLYVGEEEYGIWTMPADIARFEEKQLLDRVGQGQITADVEGMDVYRSSAGAYLIASSQGDNSYAVYDLEQGNRYIGSFRVADDVETGIDGTEETDGLTVTSAPLGAEFPTGLLVLQDGFNRLPRDTQNFKLVSWQDVIGALR